MTSDIIMLVLKKAIKQKQAARIKVVQMKKIQKNKNSSLFDLIQI